MRLERRAAMAMLLAHRGDDLLVVPGLGSTTYDLAALGDDRAAAVLLSQKLIGRKLWVK